MGSWWQWVRQDRPFDIIFHIMSFASICFCPSSVCHELKESNIEALEDLFVTSVVERYTRNFSSDSIIKAELHVDFYIILRSQILKCLCNISQFSKL